MSLAKAQNLEEQLTTKEEAWAKKMAQYKTVDKNARELCEMILAKDRNEMVLGSEYSWSSLPTLEMIQKAERAFKEYNQKRLKLMAQVMDLAEHRREIIEGLTDQISQLRNEGVEIPEVEEITAAAETKKKDRCGGLFLRLFAERPKKPMRQAIWPAALAKPLMPGGFFRKLSASSLKLPQNPLF